MLFRGFVARRLHVRIRSVDHECQSFFQQGVMDRNRRYLAFGDGRLDAWPFLVDQKLLRSSRSGDSQPFRYDGLRTVVVVTVPRSESDCGEQFRIAVFIDTVNRNDCLVADSVEVDDPCWCLAARNIHGAMSSRMATVMR